MKKAMEALKDEADRRDGVRKEYLATKVKPLNLDGLTENGETDEDLRIETQKTHSVALNY